LGIESFDPESVTRTSGPRESLPDPAKEMSFSSPGLAVIVITPAATLTDDACAASAPRATLSNVRKRHNRPRAPIAPS
jgi:hypothetical protein